jgi:hypothetical protein
MHARHVCPKISLITRRVKFSPNLRAIESKGIDVIHEMCWLRKHNGLIDCIKKAIELSTTTPQPL